MVLYNAVPPGSMMCGDRSGNAGEFFRCSTDAWTFHHDGKLRTSDDGVRVRGSAGGATTPTADMKRAARVENYRGFVFASLAEDGPGLLEFSGAQGRLRTNISTLSRGQGRIVPNCFRVIQHSQLEDSSSRTSWTPDPSVRTIHGARRARSRAPDRKAHGKIPLSYHMLSRSPRSRSRSGTTSDAQLPVSATAFSPDTWACGARSGHARVRTRPRKSIRRNRKEEILTTNITTC